MIQTPIRPADAPELPKLSDLEDASSELDLSLTFSRAAERIVQEIRDYERLGISFSGEQALELLNDLETLISEARIKSAGAGKTIIGFVEASAALRQGNG